ncbi:MAG: HDOD domain-containing protein [Desulfatitalea sp.]|nr:HDOD domain-containing protein [Desulfatitalea sp.]NNJ99474.1 HDOD domain-containing protein [Desulfatitalea sp.]
MAVVKVDQLVQGVVLAEDVLDMNARLLLAKGQEIEDKHIRVLKMWGIFEVQVDGLEEDAGTDMDPAFDSEQLEAVSADVRRIFGNVDIQHPAVREVVRLVIEYRLQHPENRFGEGAFKPGDQAPVANARDILAKIDRLDVKLPEVPSLVFQLNEVIADPMSAAGDIAGVVNKSPSLTATLLKIVNSAFYGFRSKIDSISRAVMMIGSKEVSNLALGITIMETFKDIPKQVMDVSSFLEHNLAVGTVARILAAHGNLANTEQLFVAGMLHDIGRLVLCKYFPKVAVLTFAEAAGSGRCLLHTEKELLGLTHVHLGKRLLQKWKLPYTLENNVYYHHNPSASPHPEMGSALQMADMIVHGMGVGTSGERVIPAFDVKAWERLKLSTGAFSTILHQAANQMETFREALIKGKR